MALARTTMRLIRGCVPSLTTRSLSIEIGTFKDKETAEEAVFFSKNDERLLRTLLKKVKQQADVTDKHEAKGEEVCDISKLKEILGKYNVSEGDLLALMEWKHGQ